MRAERESPQHFFLGRISIETVLRILHGFKKVEALEVKFRVWVFTNGLVESVAIEEELEEEEEEEEEEDEG